MHYNVSGIGYHGPVAQLDRALRFERRGWEFKSLRVHHVQFFSIPKSNLIWFSRIRLPHWHVWTFNGIGFAYGNVVWASWRFINRRRRGIGKLVQIIEWHGTSMLNFGLALSTSAYLPNDDGTAENPHLSSAWTGTPFHR